MFIITHSGDFHLDEIVAISILQRIFHNTSVVRTRDYKEIESLVQSNKVLAVVDVYGKYDNVLYFDHHQPGFTFSLKVKCSSAGLIFNKYANKLFKNVTPYMLERIKSKFYEEYILYVDANDNGIDINCTVNSVNGIIRVKQRTLADVVRSFKEFDDALSFIKQDLESYLNELFQWSQKYEELYEIIKKTEPGADYILTENMGNSSALVCEIEKELKRDIKYQINIKPNECRVYCVQVNQDSFESKIPLHKDWRGLRDDALCRASGIPGCVFVHINGFLGITVNLNGAIEMCKQSLAHSRK